MRAHVGRVMRAFESNDDNVDNVDKRQDFVCILYHILENVDTKSGWSPGDQLFVGQPTLVDGGLVVSAKCPTRYI